MNTQYRKNLKDVATACKNYTDQEIAKSEERMKWYIGEYTTTTSDDNTSASTKTVPSNATRCKIKRIYGLTQKFNPTTAYDDTSYMIKTMPSTVYDFDVSKVEGASEVSENLIVLSDVAETTASGVKYSIKDGVLTLNGTATSYGQLLNITLNSVDGYFKMFVDGTSTGSSGYSVTHSDGTSYNANGYYTGITSIKYWFNTGDTFTNKTYKPMLVKGSTAPTTWKQGFTGIHNLELSGLKVEGANLFDKDNYNYVNGYIDSSGGFHADNNNAMVNTMISVEPNKTYTFSVNTSQHSITVLYYNDTTFVSRQGAGSANITYITFTTPNNCNGIKFFMNYNQATIPANYISTIEPMLYKGTTIPSTYQPYVAPTTKTIDLSTILYNGNPLFEGNSLKAVGTAKDYITPYKAHKEIGTRAYQSGDEEDTSVLTDGTTTLYPLATPIEVSIDWASTLRGIAGYPNGTITLQNTYNMDTANTITYNSIIKENCCAKIVQSRSGSVVKTINLPTQASDGYSAGSVNNVRDLTTSKRIGNVDKIADLGDITPVYTSNIFLLNLGSYDYKQVSSGVNGAYLVNNYTENNAETYVNLNDFETTNRTAGLDSTIKGIIFKDSRYSSYGEFNTAITGEPLYFENSKTDEQKTSDITAVENIIEVQAGDELAFYDSNDNLVTVPSDLTYRIEVAN